MSPANGVVLRRAAVMTVFIAIMAGVVTLPQVLFGSAPATLAEPEPSEKAAPSSSPVDADVRGRVLTEDGKPVRLPLIFNCWPDGSMSKWGGERNGRFEMHLRPGDHPLLAVSRARPQPRGGPLIVGHASDPRESRVALTEGEQVRMDIVVYEGRRRIDEALEELAAICRE